MAEKIIWRESAFPEEGESATKRELKELMKEEFYAPIETDKAIEYYQNKRKQILNNASLSLEEKRELIEYYDRKRSAKIVEDEKSYKKYFNETHKGIVEEKLIDGANSALKKLLVKEHYMLAPNTVFIAPPDNPMYGLSFRITIRGVEFYDSNQTETRYDIDLIESDKPDILRQGSIYANKRLGVVRTTVIPEGYNIRNSQIRTKDLSKIPNIELEMITGLANLSKSVEYEPRAYGGRRITPSATETEMRPTKLTEKTESTLPYRRREFSDSQDLQSNVAELVNSWNAAERSKLMGAGGGDLIIRIYAVSAAHGEKQYEFIGAAPFNNLGSLSVYADLASSRGNVLATFEHAWRPPEIDGLPSGDPHRPHTRRLRGEVVLAVGNTVLPEERKDIMSLWRKRKQGLNKEEQNRLDDFLNKYGLSGSLEANLVLTPGIHYKDGRFSEGTGPAIEHVYTR